VATGAKRLAEFGTPDTGSGCHQSSISWNSISWKRAAPDSGHDSKTYGAKI